MPRAPASASRSCSESVERPVRRSRARHSSRAAVRSLVKRSNDAGSANCLTLESGPAGRLGERGEHEVPLRLRQPRPEGGGVGHVGQHDHLALDLLALGADAPGEHRRLERAHAGLEQVEMGDAAPPAAPGAVLLVARRDAPAAVGLHHPVVGGLVRRRAGEPRAQRVEQHLRERLHLAAVVPQAPDALEDRVGDRQRLRGRGRRSQEDEHQEADERRLHSGRTSARR